MSLFDAAGSGVSLTSPVSYTHTPVGNPTLVLIWVTHVTPGVLGFPTTGTVSYGGQTCTFVNSITHAGSQFRLQLYGLINPPTGAQTISVPWSGGGSDVRGYVGSLTFLGTDLIIPLGSFASAGGTSDPATATVAGVTGDLISDCVVAGIGDADLVPGTGQTARWNNQVAGEVQQRGSTENGATSVVMDWTGTNGLDWIIAGIAVKGAVTSAIKVDYSKFPKQKLREAKLAGRL